jgi:hypothetical protein
LYVIKNKYMEKEDRPDAKKLKYSWINMSSYSVNSCGRWQNHLP